MCMCGWVKITLLLVKNVFFDVKKGISELGCRVAAIYTTLQDVFKMYHQVKLFLLARL